MYVYTIRYPLSALGAYLKTSFRVGAYSDPGA